MHDNENTLRDWARKLESGAADEPTLQLARELQEQRPVAPAPPVEFRNNLRRQLLNSYDEKPGFDWSAIWRFAASGALLLLLGFAVFTMWSSLSQSTAVTTAADPNPIQIERPTAVPAATLPVLNRAVVEGTGDVGLTLRDAPGGNVLATLPDGTAVTLLGDVQDVDGTQWQAVDTPSGSGWAAAAFLAPTLPDEVTADEDPGLDWQLGDDIELEGIERTAVYQDGDYYLPGDTLDVTLSWRALDAPTADYTIFLHVLDEDGNLVAQRDAEPANGSRPTSGWAAGEQIADIHSLALPEGLPAGDYTLVIGMYDTATGEQLASSEGTSLRVGSVTILDAEPPAVAAAIDAEDDAWIESIHLAPRTSAEAPLLYDLSVGYTLRSAADAQMTLHLAEPDWEAVTEGRAPIDRVGEAVPIDANGRSTAFSITVNPAELEAILTTTAPVPVIIIDRGDRSSQAITVTNLPAALFALDDPVLPPQAASVLELAEPVINGRVNVLPLASVAGSDASTLNVPLFTELQNVASADVLVRVTDAASGELLGSEVLSVAAGRSYQIVPVILDSVVSPEDVNVTATFLLPDPTATPTTTAVPPTQTPPPAPSQPDPTATPQPADPPDDGSIPTRTPKPPADPPQSEPEATAVPPTPAVQATRTVKPPPTPASG